jgi:hypothetical protein
MEGTSTSGPLPTPHDNNGHVRHGGKRPMLGGVEVREEDVETPTGLHIATVVFRVCAGVVLALAVWQVFDWISRSTGGGAGIGVLVGETVRLVVLAGLLWAGSSLADLAVKTHRDIRAGRILLARQTYLMRQVGIAEGVLHPSPADQERRGGMFRDVEPRSDRPATAP